MAGNGNSVTWLQLKVFIGIICSIIGGGILWLHSEDTQIHESMVKLITMISDLREQVGELRGKIP